jgi:hypothetical protein
VASIPITIWPSTNGTKGEAQIRAIRMREAANTRVFLGGRFVGGSSSFYAAAREKASAARSGEMLWDGSPTERMDEPVASARVGFVERQS